MILLSVRICCLATVTRRSGFSLSGIASAQEFPFYELSGFPISPHKISVTGATGNLKEQSPSTSPTVGGVPGSPHQISESAGGVGHGVNIEMASVYLRGGCAIA